MFPSFSGYESKQILHQYSKFIAENPNYAIPNLKFYFNINEVLSIRNIQLKLMKVRKNQQQKEIAYMECT